MCAITLPLIAPTRYGVSQLTIPTRRSFQIESAFDSAVGVFPAPIDVVFFCLSSHGQGTWEMVSSRQFDILAFHFQQKKDIAESQLQILLQLLLSEPAAPEIMRDPSRD